ncbi:hypothetical protein BHE74_00052419, partial [Ensete ventricosum]
ALDLFAFTAPPSPPPLRWRRQSLAAGNRPAKRLPAQKALATTDHPCKGVVACHPCRWLGCGRTPLQGVWPWSVALAVGMAIAGRPLSSPTSLRKCDKNA